MSFSNFFNDAKKKLVNYFGIGQPGAGQFGREIQQHIVQPVRNEVRQFPQQVQRINNIQPIIRPYVQNQMRPTINRAVQQARPVINTAYRQGVNNVSNLYRQAKPVVQQFHNEQMNQIRNTIPSTRDFVNREIGHMNTSLENFKRDNLTRQLNRGEITKEEFDYRMGGGERDLGPVINFMGHLPEWTERGFARSAAQIYNTAKGQKEFTPSSNTQKLIFGKEPVKNLQSRQQYDTDWFTKKTGIGGNTAQLVGGGIAGLGVIGDLSVTGGKSKLAKSLSKVEDINEVRKLTKGLNLSEETLRTISKSKDVNEIDNLLKTKPIPITTAEKAEVYANANKERIWQEVNKGNELNPDAIRNHFQEIGYEGHNPGDYHEAGSGLTKEYYQRMLAERKKAGNNTVLFTAGTSGAGKTSSLKSIGEETSKYPIVYDSNLSSFDSAKSKIDDALKNGYDVRIVYTHNDPIQAWDNVIQRAIKGEDINGKIVNRVVPKEIHANNSVGAPKTITELADHYKDNPHVDISVVDNSGAKGEMKEVPIDFMRDKSYNKDELLRSFNDRLTQQRELITRSQENGARLYESLDGSPTETLGGRTSQGAAEIGGAGNFGGTGQPPVEPLPSDLPPDGLRKSFAIGAETSPDLSEGTRNLVKETDATYQRRLNSDLKTTANQQIDEMGFEQAKARALDASDVTDEGVARAIEVAKRLDAQGLYGEANEIIQVNAERAMQAGRAVQANALLRRFSPEGVKARIAQLALKAGREVNGVKIPRKISDEVYNKAANMMIEAQKLEPGSRDYNLAVQKTMEYVKQQFPSSIVDQILSVWQAGLLTGFKTSGLNIAANTGHGLLRKITDVPSTLFDAGIGAFTGQRTKTWTLRGEIKGISEGSKEAIDYLIHGYDPRMVGSKYEGGTTFSNNKVGQAAKAYVQTIQRFIGSQDRPFSRAAFFNSIADQAGAVAKNKGLKGKKYTNFIEKMLKSPTAEIGQRAAKDAEEAVFANDTVIGQVASKLQSVPGGKAIVPFAKTPSAVVGAVFSYIPGVAPIDEAIKMVRKGTFDQRKLAEALGKSTIGVGVLALGAELAKKKMVNTSYPSSEKEREIWKAENRQENSIVFPNGTQIQAQSLGPVGNALLIGAAMQQAKQEGKSPVAVLLAQGGNATLESPALQGLSGVIDALKDPENSGENYVQSQSGSIVPTLVKDVAEVTDKAPNGQSNMRQVNSVSDAIFNRIPLMRQNQPISIDSFGQNRTTGKGTFQTMLDPTRSKTLNKSDLLTELNRLRESGNEAGPTKQDKKISAFGKKLELTNAQLDELTKSTGGKIKTALEGIIRDPGYANLTDDQKAKLINDKISELRTQGNKMAVMNNGSASNSKTTPSQNLDIAKFKLENSGEDYLEVDGKFIYRDTNGTIKVAKSQKEIDKVKAMIQMDREGKDYVSVNGDIWTRDPYTNTVTKISKYETFAKEADDILNQAKDYEDLDTYLKAADQKASAIEAQLAELDPNDPSDRFKISDLEEKWRTNDKNRVLYEAYGGFEKPKGYKFTYEPPKNIPRGGNAITTASSGSQKVGQVNELIKKYFPQSEWGNAQAVMNGESGGNPNAVGDNYPIGGILAPSVGLFQIRTLPGRPSAEQLKDPEFNVKYAAQMWKEQGWQPWTAAQKLGITAGKKYTYDEKQNVIKDESGEVVSSLASSVNKGSIKVTTSGSGKSKIANISLDGTTGVKIPISQAKKPVFAQVSRSPKIPVMKKSSNKITKSTLANMR